MDDHPAIVGGGMLGQFLRRHLPPLDPLGGDRRHGHSSDRRRDGLLPALLDGQFLPHDGAKHGALQQRIPPKAVVPVDAAAHLSGGVQPLNPRAIHSVLQHVPLRVDGDASHAVVQDRNDRPGVEGFIVQIWRGYAAEGRLAPRVDSILGVGYVTLQRGAELVDIDVHPIGEVRYALDLSQEFLVIVVADVLPPVLRRGRRQHQREGGYLPRTLVPLACRGVGGVMGQHPISHVRPGAQFVAEPLPLRVDQYPSHASHELGRQYLGRVERIGRVDPPRGVDLNLVHVDRARSQPGGERDSVSRGEISGGRGEMHQFRAVLLEVGSGGPIGGEPSRGEDDVGRG
mmetsp:Transcript_915/g.2629  ORF Transcript_915/g.2629 Transcript_915/m.2629 type:complete len:343 (-) Transcript_915:879-1907(-)